MRTVWYAALLGALCGWAAACGDPGADPGTALFVEVAFAPDVSPTQLRFSAEEAGGPVIAPSVLPEVEAAALPSPQSVRVLLPDGLDGAALSLGVEALRGGAVLASASVQAVPREGQEVAVALELVPGALLRTPPDGGEPEPDGGLPAPDAGAGEPDGGAPGGGGAPDAGNLCAQACTTPTSDGCVDGRCVCGQGPACQVGDICRNGTCIFDKKTCTGCRNPTTDRCERGDHNAQCGAGGIDCDRCVGNRTCQAATATPGGSWSCRPGG